MKSVTGRNPPRGLLAHWRLRPRPSSLERVHPFSWPRCLVSVACYLLLLSDVLRTGLGIRDISGVLLELNTLNVFGPYAYPVAELLLANGTTTTTGQETTDFWPYKYDTTSVVMRAIAKHLLIAAWPPCVMYDQVCDEQAGLPMESVFSMIDSLVESVKIHQNSGHSTQQQPTGHLTLRVKYTWFDRLHEYVFPWFFAQPITRTCQAIHYDLVNVRKQRDSWAICGNTRPRPHACDVSWPNYGHSCASNDLECQVIHSIWTHIPARMREMSDTFPNHTIDFVVLEGTEDFSRSGLTFQGSTGFDIVTLARVRRCTGGADPTNMTTVICQTVMVDDYRYEGSAYVTNASEWYGIVAFIRVIGQVYAWTRLLSLFVGCYVARSSETDAPRSFLGKVRIAFRTMFLVPSQIATYGSVFPISCYVVAHLMDSPAVYQVMGQQLNTFMGAIQLNFWELARVCAVSMRSVWVLALLGHVWHRIQRNNSWAPTHGMLGIPEYSLTFVAAFTVFAQVRYQALRNTNILEVYEMVPSVAPHRWRSVRHDSTRGFLHRFLLGTEVDYKCLAASMSLYLFLVLLLRLANWVFPRWVRWTWTISTRTLAPYSAGTLWKTSGLVVSWRAPYDITQSGKPATLSPTQVTPLGYASSVPSKLPSSLAVTAGHNFHDVAKRTSDTQSMIYLMNLGVMTDPLTHLQLRFSGQLVGVYESKQTQRCVMLPYGLEASTADISIDWGELELLFVVNTRELFWWELLQCG